MSEAFDNVSKCAANQHALKTLSRVYQLSKEMKQLQDMEPPQLEALQKELAKLRLKPTELDKFMRLCKKELVAYHMENTNMLIGMLKYQIASQLKKKT